MKIRTIIIDDEPHAREGLRIRLQEYDSIEIIEECSSGVEAIEKINALSPDLIFLDIQMPEMNGFEVLKNIKSEKTPVVIFITAYDKYALKAFEFHAVDYLLKPIDNVRLKNALDYAINHIHNRNAKYYSEKLKAIADEYLSLISAREKFKAEEKFLNKILVKNKNVIKVISVPDIYWFEAHGDYVYIHCNSEKYILLDSLSALEKKLNPDMFIRIHRSSIVNIEQVEKLKPNEHGDFEVFLKNGTKLKLSRTYKENFQKIFGNKI
ncbi:LytR/AlgR family response regulator transcription factor [Rosettibacter firmus]|uniref:LytR/AlgR family response regulator transcription factor n=1 Tax=Rosettibacter firmus TaxID=3111522 RepID=UPI00336BC1E4